MAIPPISSFQSQSQFPSNDLNVQELQDDLESYEEYMKEYMHGDHSPQTTQALQAAAEKLLTFINQNNDAIVQICKNNGWPATETGGYDECIQGVKNCEELITQGSNIQNGPLYMMNEDVSGLISMLTTQKH